MSESQILLELIKSQTEHINDIKEDVSQIKNEVERIKSITPASKEKLQVSAAGGGLGAAIVAIIIGLMDYFKQ